MTSDNRKKLDLLFILESAKKIGMPSLRENSLHRIMYFCYIFDYINIERVFDYIYDFHIDTEGPYCSDIKSILIELQSSEYIVIAENDSKIDTFKIDVDVKEYYQKTDAMYYKKYKWIDTVIKILGLYGEERLFDFIYRDPNIEDIIKSNSTQTIDRELNTLTCNYLNSFKKEFEQYLNEENINMLLDNDKYLEAYFEYIFSQIIRGE